MYDERIETMKLNKINTEQFIEKYAEYEQIDKIKNKSNKILTDFRLNRTRKELPKNKIMEHFIIDDKMRESLPGKIGIIDILMEDKANINHQPKLSLPPANDKLWVVRPIGKYDT